MLAWTAYQVLDAGLSGNLQPWPLQSLELELGARPIRQSAGLSRSRPWVLVRAGAGPLRHPARPFVDGCFGPRPLWYLGPGRAVLGPFDQRPLLCPVALVPGRFSLRPPALSHHSVRHMCHMCICTRVTCFFTLLHPRSCTIFFVINA